MMQIDLDIAAHRWNYAVRYDDLDTLRRRTGHYHCSQDRDVCMQAAVSGQWIQSYIPSRMLERMSQVNAVQIENKLKK